MSERTTGATEFTVWAIDDRTLGYDCAACQGCGMSHPSYECGSCGGTGMLTIETVPYGATLIESDELAAIGRAVALLEARKNILSHIRDRDPKFGEAFRAARDAFTQSDIESLKALIERTAKP